MQFRPDGYLYVASQDAGAIYRVSTANGTPAVFANGGGLTNAIDFAFVPSSSVVTFGGRILNTPGSPLSVQVSNTGNAPLAISGIALSGVADFTQTNNCGQSVNAGATCTVQLSFTPGAVGSRSATLTITDNSGGVTGTTQTISISGAGLQLPAAATPSFSPVAGTYASAQTVTISEATTGAIIYYTTNGTTPTTSSTKYTAPITVGATETVKAIATATNYSQSAVASAAYAITPPPAAAPSFSPGAGMYATAQTVTISSATPGSTIYYTTNGTAPTTSSTKYTAPITVSATQTIQAIAVAANYIQSATATSAYTINAAAVRIVQTVAGVTRTAYGNGGTATAANLYNPWGVAVDPAGNIYFADTGNRQVRKVTLSTGKVSIVAGTGQPGYSGDGQLAVNAQLRFPTGVAVDSAGSVYIADYSVVRKVAASTGIISTVAGNGTWGAGGDGGPAVNAQLEYAMGVAVDSAGNLYIADFVACTIRKVTASSRVITTVAGIADQYGNSGNGGAATKATLGDPYGVTVDSTGNLYIADSSNSEVRKVTTSTGIISLLAGNGTWGYSGDGGAASSAQLYFPTGVAVDSSGNVYIADEGNNAIRKVVVSTGVITTVAGGKNGFSGDGGPATAARLSYPVGVAVTPGGVLYITDASNNRVRSVSTSGAISTVAGNGSAGPIPNATSATSTPILTANANGVAKDAAGNVYFADTAENVVREVSAANGTISTVAGNGLQGYSGDGGLATSAQLYGPNGLALDGQGNLYIADYGNHVVREVNTATGVITTFAGNGTIGYSGDNGPANKASLQGPASVSFDSAGNLYIGDSCVIRKVGTSGTITTFAGQGNTHCTSGSTNGDGGPAASATLRWQVYALAVDNQNNVYIGDATTVREVFSSSGTIKTIAGIPGYAGDSGDGGPATSAYLNNVYGLASDAGGNLYIADGQRLRTVNASGIISSVIGQAGYSGDGGLVSQAQGAPWGVLVDKSTNIYFADGTGNRIREILTASAVQPAAATPTLSPAPGNYGASQQFTIADTTPGAQIFYTLDGSTPNPGTSPLYTSPLTLVGAVKLSAIAIAPGFSQSAVAVASYNTPAATPTFSPAAGIYITAQTVSILDATSAATIYYTTNGTTPSTGSTKYTAPIAVSTNETIEAIAVATGYAQSAVATAAYTIMPSAGTPIFSPPGGIYTSAQTVTISTARPGAAIYYTTDGTTPTTSSTKYTAPVAVATAETIEAIAIASGYPQSDVATATYIINPATSPVFSPVAGAYSAAQMVAISDNTSGATIYYTTNGTSPTAKSTKYTAPIKVGATETIEAIATAPGFSPSAVAKAAYVIGPTANPGGPYIGDAGIALTLNASASVDPQGQALKYAWDFGDGSTGTGVSPSHTWANTGSFTVTVTVTNTSGISDTAATIASIGSLVLGIQSISNTNPLPTTPIIIRVTGIKPSAKTTKISFTDGAQFSYTELPIRIASDSSIIAATPLYFTTSGTTSSGMLKVSISESGTTTPAVVIAVQDLPSVASYGVQPGEMTSALLTYQSLGTASAINALEAVGGAKGNTVNVAASTTALKKQAAALLMQRVNVHQVMWNPAATIPQGTLSDGTVFNLDTKMLDLMDRLAGVFLSGGMGHVLTQVENNPTSNLSPHLLARLKSRRENTANGQVSMPDMLVLLDSVSAGFKVEKGLNDTMSADNSNNSAAVKLLDEVSSLAGAVGPLAEAGYASDSTLKSLVGAQAGALSNVNTIANALVDVGLYIAFKGTNQDAAANEVVVDMEANQSKNLIALESLAVTLVPESTIVSYANTLFSGVTAVGDFVSSDAMTKVTETAGQVIQELGSTNQIYQATGGIGLGFIAGSVESGSMLNNPDPEPNVDVSIEDAPGATSLDTMTDSDGDYYLYIPTMQPAYDYSDVTIIATDPTTGDTAGTEIIDLRGTGYRPPVDAPEIKNRLLVPNYVGTIADGVVNYGGAPYCKYQGNTTQGVIALTANPSTGKMSAGSMSYYYVESTVGNCPYPPTPPGTVTFTLTSGSIKGNTLSASFSSTNSAESANLTGTVSGKSLFGTIQFNRGDLIGTNLNWTMSLPFQLGQ
jgi:sugar lactone lactonase YvrE